MTVPALTLTTESAADVSADVLVIGVRSGRNGASILGVGDEFAAIQDELAAIGFSGGKDDLRRIPASVGSARAIALGGLGSGEPNVGSLRYAAGTATRLLRGVETIALALPVDGEDDVLAVLEGAAIGAYSFTQYRSSPLEASKRPATGITVITVE